MRVPNLDVIPKSKQNTKSSAAHFQIIPLKVETLVVEWFQEFYIV